MVDRAIHALVEQFHEQIQLLPLPDHTLAHSNVHTENASNNNNNNNNSSMNENKLSSSACQPHQSEGGVTSLLQNAPSQTHTL